jgi:uncharacterized iron-regulated membrane protein
MRRWILLLHRWSTFTLGVFVLVVCVSGSVMLFGDEIDHAVRPGLFRATGGDAGPDRAMAAVLAEHPGRRVSRMWFPLPERPVYVAELSGSPKLFVNVDPGTGRVLGTRGVPVMEWIRIMHANLQLGFTGARAVGVLGIVLLLMMATGLYLWWPGPRRMASGFRLRRRGGATLVNYDLHNLAGVFATPLLALISLTGVAIVFAGPARAVLQAVWIGSGEPAARVVSSPPAPRDSAEMLPLTELVRRASLTLPGYEVMAVVIRQRARHEVEVRLTTAGVRMHDGLARVIFDPYTGEMMRASDPRAMPPPERFRQRWMFALHAAQYGGLSVRLLYALAGVTPVLLAGTGLVVWWTRRRGRLALAERRAARAA